MLIGNKVAEKDIRDFLNDQGYYGRSAQFDELELHAIGRPGWLQVFRFSVKAKSIENQWETLFGVMKDDERFKLNEIRLFQNINRRDYLLETWSDGLMKARYSGQPNASATSFQYFKELLSLVAILAFVFGVLALLGVQ